MCGIVGCVTINGTTDQHNGLVRAMSARIKHRGPDGDGFFDTAGVSLGMRRLSIIDVAGSDQPLTNETGRITMVFNGEIYNYRELQAMLQAQGHQLRTQGDGETIIHLYEQYGLDLFRHLRGMYAFALWDADAEKLVLAVDHIGMKPLYLAERNGRLLFSSEIKAFLADDAFSPQLNLDTLDTFLSFGYPLGQETLFQDVTRLMPGHVLTVQRGRCDLSRYWAYGRNYDDQPASRWPDDEGQIIATARELLRESVQLHLRSDVPLGLFLSGGVDSAATLALMHETASGRIKTYSVGFTGDSPDDELHVARQHAEHFGTEHHERVISPLDWWYGLMRYAYAHDEPNANPSAISMLLLAEHTARDVKVVLTGLGGDELFGGYAFHRNIPTLLARQQQFSGVFGARQIADFLGWLERLYPTFKRYRIIGALPTYLPAVRHSLLTRDDGLLRNQSFDGMVFSDYLRDQLYGADLKAAWQRSQHKERTYSAIVADSWRDDPADTAQSLVINTWLTGNALLSQDKVTMAHSLEARVPFFDPALFAFADRIPPHIRLKSNKYVLREAVRPYLPAYALDRPKQGFSTPIRGWFERDLNDQIKGVLLDQNALSRQLFNVPALEKTLTRHFNGQQKQEEVIFRLLNLELWQRAFFRRC